MGEDLYLRWGKSYIEIKDGEMSVKHKGNFITNGVIGGMPRGEVICDKIENFSLLCFKIMMKTNVNFVLLHKISGTKYRIEIMVKKEEVENYLKFKTIMEKRGLFENKTLIEVMYGKDSALQNDILDIKEKAENEKMEQKDFYDELKALPGFDAGGTQKEIKH